MNKISKTNATITAKRFKDNMGAVQLEFSMENIKLQCSCRNLDKMDELATTIANLHSMAYRQVDKMMDNATAGFLKDKFKKID